MSDKQKTLAKEAILKGVGLHTGKHVTLTFKPADPDVGFVFVRTDLEGQPQVEADAQYVVSTARGTTLEKKGVKIHTTEHVLAALVGMDIDNCYIEIDNAEPPIMDGSSKFFVEAIENAGIVEQDKDREYYRIKEIVTYVDPETGSEITAIPSDDYQVTAMVDFGTKVLGTQNATLSSIKNFKQDISPARTFCFLHELEQLLEAGLVKGGDLDNAIVYVDKEITPETKEKLCKAFNRDDVSIRPNGILDHLTLHYPNEAARHKLLDVVGDLALVGKKLKAKIIATKPGHHTNTNFAKKLSKQIKLAQRNKVPEFDLTVDPVYDINQIMKLLPHRPPFLLIDKVLTKTPTGLIGVKNVTMNEPFFVGHFPKEPVMPGVLQIEAMAQLGGLLILGELENPQEYSTYFMKIENAKFKRKIVPGDTIVFKLELIEPIRRGIVHMQGIGYVNNSIAVEAEMMAVITKRIIKEMEVMNHPMAYVHPTAILGENVTISPFASVYEDVEIGDGTWIGPNVTIMPGSRIGKNCKIYPGTVISGDPQDLKYEGEKTLTYIGDNTTIRECVTVNKGTNALGYTKIGDNCLIMATAHIAHDCVVGNNVVIVNAVGLAGHIEVGDYAFIGGYSAVHQFTKIGEHAFIAGATQIRKDVPPYVKAAKNPVAYAGVNAIGLRRKGFTSEEIYEIQGIYRILYQQKNNVSQAVEQILEKFPDSHYREIILNFINTSDRGIMKGYSSGV